MARTATPFDPSTLVKPTARKATKSDRVSVSDIDPHEFQTAMRDATGAPFTVANSRETLSYAVSLVGGALESFRAAFAAAVADSSSVVVTRKPNGPRDKVNIQVVVPVDMPSGGTRHTAVWVPVEGAMGAALYPFAQVKTSGE